VVTSFIKNSALIPVVTFHITHFSTCTKTRQSSGYKTFVEIRFSFCWKLQQILLLVATTLTVGVTLDGENTMANTSCQTIYRKLNKLHNYSIDKNKIWWNFLEVND
jgi:hypothetical protein